MSEPLPICVTLIAHNEAHQLERTLAGVRDWVAQVVVVINDCTDETEAVARGCGAEVYEHAWRGYREQKNRTLDYVRQPWTLSIDADEVVTPELRASIERFVSEHGDDDDAPPAKINRIERFMGRWIRHGELYPDWHIRLFRSGSLRWEGGHVHEKVKSDRTPVRLAGHLEHYADATTAERITKIAPYADLFWITKMKAGRRFSLWSAVTRPPWRFFRSYVLKRGFLDGFPGLYIAAVAAFDNFHRYSRGYEYERNDNYRERLDAKATSITSEQE